MRRLRRVISKQSTSSQVSPVPGGVDGSGWSGGVAETSPPLIGSGSGDSGGAVRDPSFLGFLNRSSLKRRSGGGGSPSMHRLSQSFSTPNHGGTGGNSALRALLDSTTMTRHKRTLSSVLPLSPHPSPPPPSQRLLGLSQMPSAQPADFIGYPAGGLEIRNDGLVLTCEQKTPDICEYTVRREASGLRPGDMLAIALISWAGHVFFRGPLLLALLPMALYLLREGLRVCEESLVVVRDVGIQTETVTVTGVRRVTSFELGNIEDVFIHEALKMFEYRYYMAILPKGGSGCVVMFPHLLPRLEGLLPVYHGARQLLFKKD
ncbi:hypothetical protein GGI15_002513 [Coemansia interrupta]|uniref:Phosphatidylinositol N-acetylglucosaminyltransferase subunit H conserved domain-containing protein n=1 Tax=Coemansia interrupta TaxID=1126814 RepID=A0A9W8HER1_9FUNG|nr:hypothetical protein GGI15_002513 [Coemansia interrupta]